MFNFKILIFAFMALQGCSQILEPVLFSYEASDLKENMQEEFDINIHALTFKSAKKANKDPYPRQLMLTGSGARASVVDEDVLLSSKLPERQSNVEYRLGFGDILSFSTLNEYQDLEIKLPQRSDYPDYVLGIGDALTLLHLNDTLDMKVQLNGDKILPISPNSADNILESTGIIGSNGEILLLGVGTLRAENRTLSDIRAEIRNILIRGGLTPNFQLEISKFNSKKVFVNNTRYNKDAIKSEPIFLTNIPISLKEIILLNGFSEGNGANTLITLLRNKKSFRFTGNQLFDVKTPEIFLQDRDQIEIDVSDILRNVKTTIGTKGNIILPIIGQLNAVNRSLRELQEEVHDTLVSNGIIPNFQLDLIDFKGEKIYFIQKNEGASVIPLTNTKTSLKDIILSNNRIPGTPNDLLLVTLKRGNEIYRLPFDKILDSKTPTIWIMNNDQIEVESIPYKSGQVYALSGANNAAMLPINPSKRESLASVLFSTGGAFTNLNAKRSEVYLLRGRNPTDAYHLDAQNVSRILVAANTELRPNDIIYIAERPIISFTRLLFEITPLRILLRDLKDENIP